MSSSRISAVTAIAGAAAVCFLIIARSHSTSHSSQSGAIKVGFQVGEYAPDFELRSLSGEALGLSSLRGKPVLLNFWATWCAPCRIEMPWLVELDEKYRSQGLQIVGVSMDDVSATQQVAAFVQERGIRYEILVGNS